MSTKIDLQFVKSLDLDLLEKGVEVWIIRIIGQVKFKTIDGWTRVYEAIIDTGAPVSFIPKSIWTRIESKIETGILDTGSAPGRQVRFDVFTKIPVDTVPGAYEADYELQLGN